MTEQTSQIERISTGVVATLREAGRLSDVVSAALLDDGRVEISIAMGLDETDPENPEWPTEGFASIVLPAEVWAALASIG